MNVYEQVHEMFRYHFETVDSKCIKALKEESLDYKKKHDELIALLNLTWFTDLHENRCSQNSPATPPVC